MLNLNEVEATLQTTNTAECQLEKTYYKLAATEANIELFMIMINLGLATNDIKNFVVKQTIHKRVRSKPDLKVQKIAMKSKLSDACSYAKKLRQTKNSLRKKTLQKYQTDGQTGKRVYRDMVKKYRVLKNEMMYKADKKVQLYKEK